MTLTLHLILVLLALVCFFVAAFIAFSGRGAKINFAAFGLFLWLLSTLV